MNLNLKNEKHNALYDAKIGGMFLKLLKNTKLKGLLKFDLS